MHLQAYPDRQARRWQYVHFSRAALLLAISLSFAPPDTMCPATWFDALVYPLRCARPSLACAAMRMTVDDGGSKRPVFDKLYTDAAQVS